MVLENVLNHAGQVVPIEDALKVVDLSFEQNKGVPWLLMHLKNTANHDRWTWRARMDVRSGLLAAVPSVKDRVGLTRMVVASA